MEYYLPVAQLVCVFARWMNCKTPTQAILVKPQQKSNGFRIPRWKKSSFLVGNVDVTFLVFFWGLKACRGLNRRQHPVDAQGMGGRYHAIWRRIFLSDFAPFQKRCPKLWCWCISWIAKLLPSMNRSVSFSEKVATKWCSGLPPQWAVYLHTEVVDFFTQDVHVVFFSRKILRILPGKNVLFPSGEPYQPYPWRSSSRRQSWLRFQHQKILNSFCPLKWKGLEKIWIEMWRCLVASFPLKCQSKMVGWHGAAAGQLDERSTAIKSRAVISNPPKLFVDWGKWRHFHLGSPFFPGDSGLTWIPAFQKI